MSGGQNQEAAVRAEQVEIGGVAEDDDSPVVWEMSALSAGAIACCEGDNGWDDYLLLYHFDNSESIDAIS